MGSIGAQCEHEQNFGIQAWRTDVGGGQAIDG
jgi:hypothetical protein